MAHVVPLKDVDRRIGQRIRTRRLAVEMTQKQLADKLGISFQQIQKYENGSDRVSTGRFTQLAQALDTEPGHFFPMIRRGINGNAADELADLIDRPDTIKVLRALKRCNGKRRMILVEIIQACANKRKGT